jgi:hypothetical protein
MMTSGGKRKGSGRPLGSPNKPAEETPLDYMLKVMRDPDAPAERRDRMAAAAAPFSHPLLAPKVNPPDAS